MKGILIVNGTMSNKGYILDLELCIFTSGFASQYWKIV